MEFVTMALGSYQTNTYILSADGVEGCVVVDPGYAPERILAQCEKMGKRVEAILLTHGHFDHVGGVRALVAETDCDVYIHEKELSMPPQLTAGPLYYTHTYQEGALVKKAGLTFRVLETPGHTPGSVCLQVEDRLISGDTLFCCSCGRTDLPGGDWTQMRASLKRLASLEQDLKVHPGHGESSTLAYEKAMNPYMQG